MLADNLSGGGLTARSKTDVLVMANGDRLTCEIKKLERGVLYGSFDYIDGTVSLQWSKVVRVDSKQLFIVHTQDGSIYEGALRTPETPAQQPVKIEVLEASQNARPLAPAQVVEMAQTSEAFWRRLSGNIDSGLMFTKGNSTTQYTFGADLRVRGEHWRLAADFVSTLSKSSGVAAATRNQPRLWARRLIGGKRKWYYTGGLESRSPSVWQHSRRSTNPPRAHRVLPTPWPECSTVTYTYSGSRRLRLTSPPAPCRSLHRLGGYEPT